MSFHKHLQEAIAINSERKAIYSKLTKGASNKISRRLLFFEKMLLPFSKYIDRRARKFQEQGIPIVKNDFVEMHPLPEAGSACKGQKPLSKEMKIHLLRWIRAEKKQLKLETKALAFESISRRSHAIVVKIDAYEEKEGIHLAMLKHMAESIWLIAKNAVEYDQMSAGKTRSLSRLLVKAHLPSLSLALQLFDFKANIIHQAGVGILVNDLPLIIDLDKESIQ